MSRNRGGAIEAHDVRTRVAGNMTFVEFHLVVPGDMTVDAAHGLCDRIEAALLARLKDASITIHVEPESQGTGDRGWSDDREGARQSQATARRNPMTAAPIRRSSRDRTEWRSTTCFHQPKRFTCWNSPNSTTAP